jgi:hypothetical protein
MIKMDLKNFRKKRYSLFAIILVMLVSVAVASTASAFILVGGISTGQIPVWDATQDDGSGGTGAWVNSGGIKILDGNTLCFDTSCDNNIVWNGSDFIINDG